MFTFHGMNGVTLAVGFTNTARPPQSAAPAPFPSCANPAWLSRLNRCVPCAGSLSLGRRRLRAFPEIWQPTHNSFVTLGNGVSRAPIVIASIGDRTGEVIETVVPTRQNPYSKPSRCPASPTRRTADINADDFANRFHRTRRCPSAP